MVIRFKVSYLNTGRLVGRLVSSSSSIRHSHLSLLSNLHTLPVNITTMIDSTKGLTTSRSYSNQTSKDDFICDLVKGLMEEAKEDLLGGYKSDAAEVAYLAAKTALLNYVTCLEKSSGIELLPPDVRDGRSREHLKRISFSIAKAVLGEEDGETFEKAWRSAYNLSLDDKVMWQIASNVKQVEKFLEFVGKLPIREDIAIEVRRTMMASHLFYFGDSPRHLYPEVRPRPNPHKRGPTIETMKDGTRLLDRAHYVKSVIIDDERRDQILEKEKTS